MLLKCGSNTSLPLMHEKVFLRTVLCSSYTSVPLMRRTVFLSKVP